MGRVWLLPTLIRTANTLIAGGDLANVDDQMNSLRLTENIVRRRLNERTNDRPIVALKRRRSYATRTRMSSTAGIRCKKYYRSSSILPWACLVLNNDEDDDEDEEEDEEEDEDEDEDKDEDENEENRSLPAARRR
ncbi:hypothetical protein M0804_001268 [Polistes exclamans]|nr:hypothetical protein M0804_001268 [Polistes exclamans]